MLLTSHTYDSSFDMSFTITSFELQGLKLISGHRFHDNRGYFVETWSLDSFAKLGLDASFVQDNQSFSLRRGTLRGLHFQRAPFGQAKLIRVVSGAIRDVVVDIRKNSETFGQWLAVELTDQDDRQLFVPKGFAHGFVTLADNTVISYKVDFPYRPESDTGIRWNDVDLGIDWVVPETELTISAKDQVLPMSKEHDPQ